MATETTAKKDRKPIAPRRNFQRLVESTTLFCEIAIQTCEEFSSDEDPARNAVFDAQIKAYRRVLQMLNGETK